MNETLTRLFIGLNDKDTKIQKYNIQEAKEYIQVEASLLNIEGYTIVEGNGFYTHLNGCQVTEKTLIVELLFVEYETIIKLCDALKVSLNQESIALQQIELTKCELV